MSESVEIEFKTMLHENDYQKIVDYFHLLGNDFFMQENTYFDTKDFQLKEKNMGLRIRTFADAAEVTLKVPQKIGLLEVTDQITLAAAKKACLQNKLPIAPHVFKQLTLSNINPEELTIIAQLKTKRAEKQLPQGHLALDENWYGTVHDFELELEVQDSHATKQDFFDLLASLDISYRPAENKIRRALAAYKDNLL